MLSLFANWNRLKTLFMVVGGLALVGLLFYWFLWNKPELWNATASQYREMGLYLTGENRRLRLDSTRQQGQIGRLTMVRDSLSGEVTGLQQQQRDAVQIGEGWHDKFLLTLSKFNLADARLTDTEREYEYKLGLMRTGYLKAGPVDSVAVASPAVVGGGLQAVREVEAGRTRDSVQRKALGTYSVQNQALTKAVEGARQGFVTLAANAKEAGRGGIPILRHRRRKEARRLQQQAEAEAESIRQLQRRTTTLQDKVSELERIENRTH